MASEIFLAVLFLAALLAVLMPEKKFDKKLDNCAPRTKTLAELYCIYCGERKSIDDEYCRHCGKKLLENKEVK